MQDCKLNIRIPKEWRDTLSNAALDEMVGFRAKGLWINTSIAEMVRRAIADKYKLPYTPLEIKVGRPKGVSNG